MATTHDINPDLTTRAGRMLAAGRLTVTFTSANSGEHITITTKSRKPDENGKWVSCPLAEAKVVFFSVPNADGGWDDKVGKFTYGRGFVAEPGADAARVFCAKQAIVFAEGRELPSGLRAQEESRCGKCGRPLTDPVSIDRGIGPDCYGDDTGSKHQTKAQRDPETGLYPYGTVEAEAELIAFEEREYEREMREGF
jgi:hypothetical protein